MATMDDKPSQALRYGRWKSSMWLAIDAVKKGEADVAVSAGNTGALMAMARFNLKMKEGIERPAIAALWPTLKGESVVLDVGAAIGADEMHLVNLAAMSAGLRHCCWRRNRNSLRRKCAAISSGPPIAFPGSRNEIGAGVVDALAVVNPGAK